MKKLIVLGLLLAGCSPDKTEGEVWKERIEEYKQAQIYKYEPAISTLTGKLEMQNCWGPPGYGEDTLTDAKEACVMLILETPIDVEADSTNDFNLAVDSLAIIQLASATKLDDYFGKRVTVKGKLFGAQTGHHHTAVLMDVQKVEGR